MRLDELENDFTEDQGQYESGLSIGSKIAFVMVAIVIGMLFIVSSL